LTALFLAGAYFVRVPPVGASPTGESPAGLFLVQRGPIADDDVIALLGLSLGGRDVAVATWSNMNPFEKQTLRDQAARIAAMARGAERDGLPSHPDVARSLRWGISSFLAEAWEKKISSETDLSESAARSFYEANRQMYMDEGLSFEQRLPRIREDLIRSAIRERLEKLNSE